MYILPMISIRLSGGVEEIEATYALSSWASGAQFRLFRYLHVVTRRNDSIASLNGNVGGVLEPNVRFLPSFSSSISMLMLATPLIVDPSRNYQHWNLERYLGQETTRQDFAAERIGTVRVPRMIFSYSILTGE